MKAYFHVTTQKKMARYIATGCILPPVRFWSYLPSAVAWAQKTGRSIILEVTPTVVYPLPDHKPAGHAHWTPELVREWTIRMEAKHETVTK